MTVTARGQAAIVATIGDMIGVVVVTHGQLATELVNAAEMIVGDLPQFTAVSIGWHDDVNDAREDIAQAIERVRGEDGVLLLTDMFGGTPSNLGMTFLETDRLEVITGVNLPMLIKLAEPARARRTCSRSRGRCATTAATRSGSRRICCAARRAAAHDVAQAVTVVNQLGHARARGGEVRPPGDALRGARHAWRATRARWTARASWAFCCWRRRAASTITISADGADERRRRRRRWRRWSQSGFGEDACNA